MTTSHHGNVSFALLDAAVIDGRADEPVLGRTSHAQLLEEAAALGGVLRHLGVHPGDPVVVDLEDDTDAVVAALAVARIGGTVTRTDDDAAPVVIASAGSSVPARDRVRMVRGGPVEDPDLEWEVMLRAGRTDPAPCEALERGSAYSPERSVEQQIAVLEGSSPPYDPGELRHLLQV